MKLTDYVPSNSDINELSDLLDGGDQKMWQNSSCCTPKEMARVWRKMCSKILKCPQSPIRSMLMGFQRSRKFRGSWVSVHRKCNIKWGSGNWSNWALITSGKTEIRAGGFHLLPPSRPEDSLFLKSFILPSLWQPNLFTDKVDSDKTKHHIILL